MAAQKASRRAAPAAADLDTELNRIAAMPIEELRRAWRFRKATEPPAAFSGDLLARALAYELQEQHLGGLGPATRKLLASMQMDGKAEEAPRILKPGSILVREHEGTVHEVMVVPDGYLWNGQRYSSLSTIARRITGVSWSGPRFFGLLQNGKSGQAFEAGADKSLSAQLHHAVDPATAVRADRKASRPSAIAQVRR